MRRSVNWASLFTLMAASAWPHAGNAANPTPPDVRIFAAGEPGASGISPDTRNNPVDSLTVVGEPLPTSPPPMGGLFPSAGQALLDHGFDLHGTILDSFLANPSAGIFTGHTKNLGAISPAVDIDLGKLAGLPGANVHFAMTQYFAKSGIPAFISQTGGTLTGYQTTPQTPTSELDVLTFEQKMFSDKFSVEVGRTNLYHYFFLPVGLDVFTYPSTTIAIDGDFVTFPHAVWGGRATYNVTPEWSVQAGAFEDNSLRTLNNPYVLGTGSAAGVQVVAEVAQRSRFDTADYPSSMELGIEYNTRNKVNNIKGTAIYNGLFTTPTVYKGGGVVFFQGEKVVWRGPAAPGGPPPNVAVYGSFDFAVDKPQPIDLDALLGATITGLVPGRPLDALGLQAHYQRLSGIEANFESVTQTIFAGPGRSQPRDGYAFEAIGNIQLTDWAALRPLVEYFVQPDAYYRPAQSQRPHDGFMAGIFGIVSIGPLLGTSRKPF